MLYFPPGCAGCDVVGESNKEWPRVCSLLMDFGQASKSNGAGPHGSNMLKGPSGPQHVVSDYPHLSPAAA